MPVTVTDFNGRSTTYDSADGWEIDSANNLLITNNINTIGTHAKESWMDVKKNKKEDVQLKLEEALDLIGLVDGGQFSNQDEDWRERATELLND